MLTKKRLPLLFLSLIVIAMFGIILWGLSNGSRYEARLDALRANGEPTSYVDLGFSTNSNSNTVVQAQIKIVGNQRQNARVMNDEVKAAIADEDYDLAAQKAISLLEYSTEVEKDSLMIGYSTIIPCRGMAIDHLQKIVRQDSLTKEMRDAVKLSLERQTGLAGLQKSFVNERVVGIETFKEGSFVFYATALGWRDSLLDAYEELLPAVRKPWHLGNQEVTRICNAKKYPDIVQQVLSGNQNVYLAANRDLASQRCLRILNELGRYKAEEGTEAKRLSDLPLTKEQRQDPFSGKPLLIKWTEKGWVVYSVFENGKDDGGQCGEDQLDWGLLP